jgi:hypothetical protein
MTCRQHSRKRKRGQSQQRRTTAKRKGQQKQPAKNKQQVRPVRKKKAPGGWQTKQQQQQQPGKRRRPAATTAGRKRGQRQQALSSDEDDGSDAEADLIDEDSQPAGAAGPQAKQQRLTRRQQMELQQQARQATAAQQAWQLLEAQADPGRADSDDSDSGQQQSVSEAGTAAASDGEQQEQQQMEDDEQEQMEEDDEDELPPLYEPVSLGQVHTSEQQAQQHSQASGSQSSDDGAEQRGSSQGQKHQQEQPVGVLQPEDSPAPAPSPQLQQQQQQPAEVQRYCDLLSGEVSSSALSGGGTPTPTISQPAAAAGQAARSSRQPLEDLGNDNQPFRRRAGAGKVQQQQQPSRKQGAGVSGPAPAPAPAAAAPAAGPAPMVVFQAMQPAEWADFVTPLMQRLGLAVGSCVHPRYTTYVVVQLDAKGFAVLPGGKGLYTTLLVGCPLLGLAWVTASLAAGRLLPVEAYLAQVGVCLDVRAWSMRRAGCLTRSGCHQTLAVCAEGTRMCTPAACPPPTNTRHAGRRRQWPRGSWHAAQGAPGVTGRLASV